MKKENEISRELPSPFSVETLEPRMMLSTVSVFASGETGEENMQVLMNDTIYIDTTVSTSVEAYEFEVDGNITFDDVRIQFTNDLYQPEAGFDRNLFVDSLHIDDATTDYLGPNVFSTGTWTASEGVAEGFGRGNALHTDGFMEIRSGQFIEFNFVTYQVVGNPDSVSVDDSTNQLRLTGENGPVYISTEIAIEAGAFYDLNIDAVRTVVEGGFQFDSQPWATVGINFYGFNGQQVDQFRTDVNGGFESGIETRKVSEEATTAFLWVWIDGFDTGTNLPIDISTLEFVPTDVSSDNLAPTATIVPFVLTEPTGEEVNFAIDFEDDTLLDDIPATVTVFTPFGQELTAFARAGTQGNTDTFQRIIFGVLKEDGSDWTPQDNGLYSVRFDPQTLTDAAGNTASAADVGLFELAIVEPEPDTEAPGIYVASDGPITEETSTPLEFVVYTSDNRDPIPYARQITIFNDSGFEQVVFGIAGGVDQELGLAWELYQVQPPNGLWTTDDNGEYQIRLDAGDLVDASGNEAPAQILGSFAVTIDEPLVG